jgi:hypothetical protein
MMDLSNELINIVLGDEIIDMKHFVDEIAASKADDTFADATLRCEGQTIRCHRVILAARSETFKAMFAHCNFKEGS